MAVVRLKTCLHTRTRNGMLSDVIGHDTFYGWGIKRCTTLWLKGCFCSMTGLLDIKSSEKNKYFSKYFVLNSQIG